MRKKSNILLNLFMFDIVTTDILSFHGIIIILDATHTCNIANNKVIN